MSGNDLTFPLRAYAAAMRLAAPFLPLWLGRRVRAGKEDKNRLGERSGIASLARPNGPLVWFHAASVGETQMLRPVLARLAERRPDIHILITTGTITSAETIANDMPARAMHQFVPADTPIAAQRFADHWQPDLAIFAESELWPNLIGAVHAAKAPLALINARMSAASLERWNRRAPKSFKTLMGRFSLILAANKETADGLSWALDKQIEASGNLKRAAPPLPADTARLEKYQAALAGRLVWCAASTHEGEEEIVAKAMLDIKAKAPDTFLILAPRHPERAEAVRELLIGQGLSVIRYSSGRMPRAANDVLLIDKIGHMGTAYRLAPVSFVGGSLIDGLSGHNPLEPARLGSAVITGPHIASFADTYMALMAFDGVKRILTSDTLSFAVWTLLTGDAARAAQSAAANAYASSTDDVLDYVWQHLSKHLPPHVKAGHAPA